MKLNDLKETITNITEPRRVSCGNIRHKLNDIIIIGLCTVICGGEDYNDMEAFGLEREEWLRTFLDLPNGISDSDTFRRLFERLNPAELSECLNSWLEIEREKRSVIDNGNRADGKQLSALKICIAVIKEKGFLKKTPLKISKTGVLCRKKALRHQTVVFC